MENNYCSVFHVSFFKKEDGWFFALLFLIFFIVICYFSWKTEYQNLLVGCFGHFLGGLWLCLEIGLDSVTHRHWPVSHGLNGAFEIQRSEFESRCGQGSLVFVHCIRHLTFFNKLNEETSGRCMCVWVVLIAVIWCWRVCFGWWQGQMLLGRAAMYLESILPETQLNEISCSVFVIELLD